ncbi:hypothetical protein F3N42_09470 [Marinihelvus fidelis]|uniref:RcnB family protein n=1 Tax=Marinihelvus fidelis TaxID=2613842 RepID=A0A5N0TCG6_9GAMM|nr:anti-virulence regulator CigR family protein [Marinihelvus fidelis]KAA9131536.1 hypothetical protein F3N42_09470 [Marinihelvus fidelis]
MRTRRFGTVILAAALAMPVAVMADPPAHAGNKGNKSVKVNVDVDLASGLISVADARQLAIDTGATGYKPLPPGIRKNLARGKPMPPGIAKTRMPGGYYDRLPHRDGYDWQVAGTDLLLIQAGTQLVAEVLEDVFR